LVSIFFLGISVYRSSGSFGQKPQQKLWSKFVAGALVKGSRSFGQKQQELSSKVARAFVKSSKSNDIGRREGED